MAQYLPNKSAICDTDVASPFEHDGEEVDGVGRREGARAACISGSADGSREGRQRSSEQYVRCDACLANVHSFYCIPLGKSVRRYTVEPLRKPGSLSLPPSLLL